MDDIHLRLEKVYCPPIDSSLFSAIVSDYDLSNPTSLKELRATLDTLRDSAVVEENATFDPSGTSSIRDNSTSAESSERAKSWHGDAASIETDGTALTGLSQALASVDLANKEFVDSDKKRHEADLEGLSPEEKCMVLKEMFPQAKEFDVTYTLKKAHYNFGNTMEELLNQAFLESDGLDGGEGYRRKGIEAFTEPAISGRKRRIRKKQRQLLRRTSSTPAPDAEDYNNTPVSRSRWDRAKEDVDFISQRTFVSPQVITSIYHKSGASLPATIAAICASTDPDFNPNPYLVEASPAVLEAHATELAVTFQRLSFSQLKSLIALTHPSTASAHELARALTFQQPSSSTNILPQYLLRPSSPDSTILPSSSVHPSLPFPNSTATDLAVARSNAFAQAQSAYRKSKSKPLMNGAAAYYSSVGRDASAFIRRYEAAAAEALVVSQSKHDEVDLHGITVKDAVNIARTMVESWWEREGREWARQGRVMGGGLRIITGAGRHSEGGRGKLGPAVGGMLVREGWKVEIGDGVVEIVGRARK